MTQSPKEYAGQIFDIYLESMPINAAMSIDEEVVCAKLFATIAVKAIIDSCPFKDVGTKFDSISTRLEFIENYYQEVLKEIQLIN